MARSDLDTLAAARSARLAAAAAAPWWKRAARGVAVAWNRYLISTAANCFAWWERLIVHATLGAAVGLVAYGGLLVTRGARAALASTFPKGRAW
jgi:hypothetical protein